MVLSIFSDYSYNYFIHSLSNISLFKDHHLNYPEIKKPTFSGRAFFFQA
jgi:hypothetical protein